MLKDPKSTSSIPYMKIRSSLVSPRGARVEEKVFFENVGDLNFQFKT